LILSDDVKFIISIKFVITMNASKQKSFFLLFLFIVSFLFQIVYTINVFSVKQFIDQDAFTKILPKKNITGDNLLTNFIEEETKSNDASLTIYEKINLLHLKAELNQDKINFEKNDIYHLIIFHQTPLIIAIRNLRI